VVHSGALAARNGSVVNHVNTAPTTVAGCVDTALTIRVDHTRILDGLSLSQNRNLTGNQVEQLGRVEEFAIFSV